MSLTRIVQIRDAVDKLCEAIDRGDVVPVEREMIAIATLVSREVPNPLRHDLVVKLASRTTIGRAALKKVAQ